MTLKDLLDTTNDYDQIRIHIASEISDTGLVTIFKGTIQDARHYYRGVDKAMNMKVGFINLTVDHVTKAPIMSIVIH